MSGTNVENYDALVKRYGKILNDKEERLSVRFRALFSLKNLNGKDAIDQIGLCFDDTSELLKHELAYCLGQMGSKDALDLLKSVLENHNQGMIFEKYCYSIFIQNLLFDTRQLKRSGRLDVKNLKNGWKL